jgi:hypothetical protein
MTPSPIRDACQVTLMQIYAIGLLGGLVSASVIAGCQLIGLITIPLSAQNLWISFLFHLFLSGWIAQAYGFLFRSAHRSGVSVSLGIGLIHWLIAGLGIGLIAFLKEAMPGQDPRQILSPGLFVLGEGFGGVIAYFAAHMSYAATVGFTFDRVAMCDEFPLPMRN